MTEFSPTTKLLYHARSVIPILEGRPKAPPVGVEISPTGRCPAHCPWCLYHGERSGELDPDVLVAALRDLAAMGTESVT